MATRHQAINFSFPFVPDHHNATTAMEQQPDARKGIVSFDLWTDLLVLWPSLWLFILPPGVLANAINIRTFLRMGLDDCVTISFFVLALSDFMHLSLPLANIGFMVLLYLEAQFSVFFVVQPIIPYVYLMNLAATFNTLTSLVTAYLAVQRCLCIVLPFRFKTVFTKQRTWYVMATLTFFSLAYGLVYATGYAPKAFLHPSNKTQYALVVLPSFHAFQVYINTILFMFINLACQIMAIASLVIMTYSLKASVKFREETRSTTAITTTTSMTKATGVRGSRRATGGTDVEKKGGRTKAVEADRRATKERMAIVQVAILTSIYVATNFPKITIAIADEAVPEFRFYHLYSNLFFVCMMVRITADYINSAVNILIYYKYNSKFRRLCFSKGGKNV